MNFENTPRFASRTSGSKTIYRFSETQPTSGELGPARESGPCRCYARPLAMTLSVRVQQ